MKQYENNPRTITDAQLQNLRRTLIKLGDLSGVVHDLNSDQIVGGNQRSKVFNVNECQIEITTQLDEPDIQGTVALGYIIWEGKKYSYRQVRWTKEWCDEANIVANKAGGTWDFKILETKFGREDLVKWGFEVGEFQFAYKENVPAKYTRKIEAPIYRPSSETPPAVTDLYDDARAKQLLSEIAAAELPEDVKEFLSHAARRHTVFNYKKIAEYYAHAAPELQRLMENSALVIIDFDRAIELGYVRLSQAVAGQFKKDYPDEDTE